MKRLRNFGLGWIAATLLCWLFYSKTQPEQIAAASVAGLAGMVFVNSLMRYARAWLWARRFLF